MILKLQKEALDAQGTPATQSNRLLLWQIRSHPTTAHRSKQDFRFAMCGDHLKDFAGERDL